jgi:CBS domain-containing protein
MIYRNVGALIREQTVIALKSHATVQEAAEKMAEHCIGAIPVIDSGELKGLFTERDLLNRVVAKGLQPRDTLLDDVMTKDPITIASEASLVDSFSEMFVHKFRHLPVLEQGRVVGVLSCRDIPANYQIMWENWLSAQNELKVASG